MSILTCAVETREDTARTILMKSRKWWNACNEKDRGQNEF
jgi:hypothetical protein